MKRSDLSERRENINIVLNKLYRTELRCINIWTVIFLMTKYLKPNKPDQPSSIVDSDFTIQNSLSVLSFVSFQFVCVISSTSTLFFIRSPYSSLIKFYEFFFVCRLFYMLKSYRIKWWQWSCENHLLPVCKFGKMKVSELLIFLSCVLSAVICVPSNLADNANDDGVPIKYDGAQLWRIPLDKENSKQILSELQENFGKLWSY